MNKIVVYTSSYGSTEEYAQWVAAALGCKALKLSDVAPGSLSAYDVVIYGGGLYASGVAGFKKFLAKLGNARAGQQLILFMVGLTDPAQQDAYQASADGSIPPEMKDSIKWFAFQGNLLFSRMGFVHKTMMRMLKSMSEKKPPEERTAQEAFFADSSGKDVINTKKEAIAPLVGYVEGLKAGGAS